jgi:hypothetical protein
MTWTCSSCESENAGGLFCIGCGTKKPETPASTIPISNSVAEAQPHRAPILPWVITGIALLATIAFGSWQGTLISAGEELVSETKTELTDTRRLYAVALETAKTAEAWKDTCLYSSWCWASTFANAVDDANTANAVASAFRGEVTRLENELADAEEKLDRYISTQSVAWVAGGVGTVGTGVWAVISQNRHKRQGGS